MQINCPRAVVNYNSHMGFLDHLKSLYEIDRKSRKLQHRLFFHFVDVCITNAYILHKNISDIATVSDVKNVKDFRLNVIRHLMLLGSEDSVPKKRPSKSPVATKNKKPCEPEEIRFQGTCKGQFQKEMRLLQYG